MAFPNRAIVIAPLARDLSLEDPHTRRIPGASDTTRQAFDTLNQDFWVALNDAALTGYGTFAAMPLALKKMVVQVVRYNDVTATTGAAYKRLADCTATDFLKVSNAGVPSVKAATALVAGDRPTEWEPMHRWFGNVAETLGAP